MKLNIAVLAGDGIGPEIMQQGVAVVKAAAERFAHDVSFTPALCGAAAIERVGNPFPEETFTTCMPIPPFFFAKPLRMMVEPENFFFFFISQTLLTLLSPN